MLPTVSGCLSPRISRRSASTSTFHLLGLFIPPKFMVRCRQDMLCSGPYRDTCRREAHAVVPALRSSSSRPLHTVQVHGTSPLDHAMLRTVSGCLSPRISRRSVSTSTFIFSASSYRPSARYVAASSAMLWAVSGCLSPRISRRSASTLTNHLLGRFIPPPSSWYVAARPAMLWIVSGCLSPRISRCSASTSTYHRLRLFIPPKFMVCRR